MDFKAGFVEEESIEIKGKTFIIYILTTQKQPCCRSWFFKMEWRSIHDANKLGLC